VNGFSDDQPIAYFRWQRDGVLKFLEQKVPRQQWPLMPWMNFVPGPARQFEMAHPRALYPIYELKHQLLLQRSRGHYFAFGILDLRHAGACSVLRREPWRPAAHLLRLSRQVLEQRVEDWSGLFKLQIRSVLRRSSIPSTALDVWLAQHVNNFAV